MGKVLKLWLADHPGGEVEDFAVASRPFNAERGSRHRRAHHAFLAWLNGRDVQQALFRKDVADG
jgi:hypothetical protein